MQLICASFGVCRATGPKRNRTRPSSRSRGAHADAGGGGSDGGVGGSTAEPRESRRTRKARAKGDMLPHERVDDGLPAALAAHTGEGNTVSPPPGLPRFTRENDDGNIEYKLRLKHPTPFRFQQLVSSLERMPTWLCHPTDTAQHSTQQTS